MRSTCHRRIVCDAGSMDNMQSYSAKLVQAVGGPLVCVIAYDGLCTFEFGMAVELFALPRPEFGNWYRFETVRAEPGELRGAGGLNVEATADLELLAHADLIVVPGWRGVTATVPHALCDALRAAHCNGARIASICSGVFVLAAAGLLDGRMATTHWRYAAILADRFPQITVDPDVLFVEADGIYTSAGSAAGLDLGLHIIRQDFGAQVAASVARRLVLPAQRDGGQRQFVPRPEPNRRAGTDLASLQDRIRASIDEDWSIARMAKAAGMSERTLARCFRQETGFTPMNWLKGERISRATELLEESDLSLNDVWPACGFGSSESFRREFRKALGVPPLRYRERMGAASPNATVP